jgi:hypothetical protein
MTSNIPRWSDNSREERYFTAVLFQALLTDVGPFWNRLRPLLKIAEGVAVVDIGYEVCMLRDLAHAKHIDRVTALEKQTFDLVLTLSNDALVLIEAKAHQGFSTSQIENMIRAGEILIQNRGLGVTDVYLAGIHSSRYSPLTVRSRFPTMKLVTWNQLADKNNRGQTTFIAPKPMNRPTRASARPPVAAPSLRFRRDNGRRASLDVGALLDLTSPVPAHRYLLLGETGTDHVYC